MGMTFSPAETASALALIRLALAEDLGEPASVRGDITSRFGIPENATGAADFVARSPGVVAGLPILALVAAELDAGLVVELFAADGDAVAPGSRVAGVAGPLRSLLAAERTMLNFAQRLSGVATLTRQFVGAAAGTGARILDTRKTTPGFRLLEKYAVRAGGGVNHRVGLYDAVLIKDNHLAGLGAGGVGASVAAARAAAPAGCVVQVEVDTLAQLEDALAARPDIVLLDNMSNDELRAAVARRGAVAPGVLLEASGGVNLRSVRGIAETGVDRVSVGAVTHSAPALDIGLDYRA